MVILSSYSSGASYGLLGPQMAATIIQETSPYDCIVIAVTRDNDLAKLSRAIDSYFGPQTPIIGFSLLGGGTNLITLAESMKRSGAITLLAGPQAEVDFKGEPDQINFPHRFKGYRNAFSFALQGPAEQMRPYLVDAIQSNQIHLPGFSFQNARGRIESTPMQPLDRHYLGTVNWGNLFQLDGATFKAIKPSSAQVLQQIGCPYARRTQAVDIEYPTALAAPGTRSIRFDAAGCSFCDVAIDKGFHGRIDLETVLSQIKCLPGTGEGRKIPFELINENPLPTLSNLLQATTVEELKLSEIHLTLRADWLLHGESHLSTALNQASKMNLRIVLASVGFESFDNRLLDQLNKGLSVETNLAAVQLIRQLKREYRDVFGYLRHEGGNHGFIHPTPWDTPETQAKIQEVIATHNLAEDILPNHSTPLIIHHASTLGNWIRSIETAIGKRFPRQNSWIAWWEKPF